MQVIWEPAKTEPKNHVILVCHRRHTADQTQPYTPSDAGKPPLRYHLAGAVIGVNKSSPDTGLRVTPMIPPRNSLAVGWVVTCTAVSPQYQWSTRPCGDNLHDSAVVLRRAPQAHFTWARTGPCTEPRFQEPARSWWGYYLHSSVPSLSVVYTTLRRKFSRFCCRPPASSPSTLHVSSARTSPCMESRFQEPTRSCFLLDFYAKLSQSSTRVWPVIITFVRSPAGTGEDADVAVGFQR